MELYHLTDEELDAVTGGNRTRVRVVAFNQSITQRNNQANVIGAGRDGDVDISYAKVEQENESKQVAGNFQWNNF